MRPTRSPFSYRIAFVSIRAIRGQKKIPNNSWAIIFQGISVAPARDNFKLSQVVPVVVIYLPPHCISANSCDRPGRHLSYCNYSCPFVQFVGKNISLRTSARKRQLQVVPSCPRCRHIPHCISVDSCDRPGRHLSIATIRVNFFDIFGCARHNSNKFGFALACTKIRAIRGQ